MILIQFASRNRPQRFKDTLYSIFNLAVNPDSLIIHAVIDKDDEWLDHYRALIATHEKAGQIIVNVGESTSKIHAINRELPKVDWDILVNVSDDMRFTVFGWDQLIRDGFRQAAPEKEPRFLHFPEKDSGMSIAPMSIINRAYYEIDKFIYHPSYISLWCDNEELEKAKIRGMYQYMGVILFLHLNPAYGHLKRDQMFDEQQAYYGVDEDNFKERKARNFDLQINPDDEWT